MLLAQFNFVRIETPLGEMAAAAGVGGLTRLEFDDRRDLVRSWSGQSNPPMQSMHPVLALLVRELDAYFAGALRRFTVPLEPSGTPFQQRVWGRLRELPYGRTCSYLELANSIRDARATRAVARANGDNPLAIIIPCHRVIGADGSLTGYGGGLWRKQRLLDLERGDSPLFADAPNDPP